MASTAAARQGGEYTTNPALLEGGILKCYPAADNLPAGGRACYAVMRIDYRSIDFMN